MEPGGPNNDIIAATEGFFIPGLSDFIAPLDLVKDLKTGNLYSSEFGGDGRITLLRPKS